VIKEYVKEIKELKELLVATRNKDGVYLPADRFEEMNEEIADKGERITELEDLIEHKEKELEELKQIFDSTVDELNTTNADLKETKATLATTTEELDTTKNVLEDTQEKLEEEKVVVQEHTTTEEEVQRQGSILIKRLEESISDVGGLHDKIGEILLILNILLLMCTFFQREKRIWITVIYLLWINFVVAWWKD